MTALQWSADRFYWAILDVSVLPRHLRHSSEHRGYLLEGELPVPIDSVQAAYASLGGDRVLACAVDRARLDEALDPRARVLTPDSVPDGLLDSGAAPVARLNLLTGAYQPRATRRARQRMVALALVLFVAGTTIATAGFLRRAAARHTLAEHHIEATRHVLEDALGRSVAAERASISTAAIELENRIAAIARTRDGDPAERHIFDAAAAMSALLGAWPAEALVEMQQLTIAADRIVGTGIVFDAAEPARIQAALGRLEDWVPQPPEFNQQPDETWSATWRLRYRPAGGAP